MIETFKPYVTYRNSNVPWLGKIPDHWTVMKLRAILKNVAIRNRSDLPLLSVVREKGVIVRDISNKDVNHNFIPDDLTNYKVVRAGQFAMNKMKAWQGSFGVSQFDGIVSPAYFVFDLNGVDGRFFHTAIRSKLYVHFFNQSSDGVRIGQWDLAQTRMREIPFFIPPPDEQAAIVHYLDHVDRDIRKYIRAKQKLIKLLEEQKQAIIHQAVTRGLDPDVPMKESGVDWLGDVPEHWKVCAIKRATRILRGKFTHRPRNDPSLYDGSYPFIQTGDVARAEKTIETYKQSVNDAGLNVSKMFPSGTLVMTIAANIGDVAILNFEACFPDSIVGFVPGSNVARDYLYYVFCSMKSEMLKEAPVNTQGNLNVERIGSRKIAIPPIQEQRMLVDQIERSTVEVDHGLKVMKSELLLINEYRTRLIADVVTGKVDVRAIATNLPDIEDSGTETEEILDEDLIDTDDAKYSEEDIDADE